MLNLLDLIVSIEFSDRKFDSLLNMIFILKVSLMVSRVFD